MDAAKARGGERASKAAGAQAGRQGTDTRRCDGVAGQGSQGPPRPGQGAEGPHTATGSYPKPPPRLVRRRNWDPVAHCLGWVDLSWGDAGELYDVSTILHLLSHGPSLTPRLPRHSSSCFSKVPVLPLHLTKDLH